MSDTANSTSFYEVGKIMGIPIRVTEVIPEEVIGIGDGRTYIKYFWEGAEIAIIKRDPNTGSVWLEIENE